jgi:hypothetical protein
MGCKEVAAHVSRAYCEWSWGGRQRWREAPWRPVYHTRVWRKFLRLGRGVGLCKNYDKPAAEATTQASLIIAAAGLEAAEEREARNERKELSCLQNRESCCDDWRRHGKGHDRLLKKPVGQYSCLDNFEKQIKVPSCCIGLAWPFADKEGGTPLYLLFEWKIMLVERKWLLGLLR